MELQLYYFDKQHKKFSLLETRLGRRINAPLVLNEDGTSFGHFAIKNSSTKVINNISISGSGLPLDRVWTSAISAAGIFPSFSNFTSISGISYSYTTSLILETLMPGEFINLFIHGTAPSDKYSIDLDTISLDITYRSTDFSIKNLITHLEFTEVLGSTTTLNRKNDQNYTVTDSLPLKYIIKGAGNAFFNYPEDKIIANNTADFDLKTSLSVFFRGVIKYSETDSKILNIHTPNEYWFGLNAERKPVIQFDTDEFVVAATPINDTIDTHVFGYSINKDSNHVIISIDGNILNIESRPTTAIDFLINGYGADPVDLGGFTGRLGEVLIFSEFKAEAFHKYISVRI